MRRLSKAVKASRANGARSRGPVTDEGKRRSSLNALRHGLLAKNVVLNNESEELFTALLSKHIIKFDPADDVEQCAVDEMVASVWRMRRLWAIEKSLFQKATEKRTGNDELERLSSAFSDLAATPELQLLDRYEARLHRMYQRSLYNFLILREFDLPDSQFDPAGSADTTNYQTNLFPDMPLAA